MGSLRQLCILFFYCLGNKEPGRRHQVVYSGDHSKKQEKYAKQKDGTIDRPEEEHKGDHHEVDRDQEKGDSTMGETPVEQEVVDMISIGAERRPAMEDPDAENP